MPENMLNESKCLSTRTHKMTSWQQTDSESHNHIFLIKFDVMLVGEVSMV